MHQNEFLRRLFAFAAACAMSIGKAVERGPGARLVLADRAPFPWETACIFAPYTADGDIDAATGVRGGARHAHGIAGRDDINLLMFVEQGRTVRSVAHRRDCGDFGPELAEVQRLASRERQATAQLVAALAELDARRLLLGRLFVAVHLTTCAGRSARDRDPACTRAAQSAAHDRQEHL